MKNFLLFLMAFSFSYASVAQRVVIDATKDVCTDPEVQMSVLYVGNDDFTVQFQPNAECANYYFVAMTDADISMWTAMMGTNVEQLIQMWGVHATNDTTFTWTDMTPNTIYKVMALPFDAQNQSYSYNYIEVTTGAIGGNGIAVIDIQVTDITAHSARVTCTPNDQTASFYDGLITVEGFNAIGVDSTCTVLRLSAVSPFYSTDDWLWQNLLPNTDYYAIAFGQNAIGVWGDTTIFSFTTLDNVGVQENENGVISIYPMPCNGSFYVAGNDLMGTQAQIFSLTGQLVYAMELNANNNAIETQLSAGHYVIRIMKADGHVVASGKVTVR